MDGTRRCYVCKTARPLNQFGNRKDKPLGKSYVCRECNRQVLADWKNKNPERAKTKAAAQISRWYDKNPEKRKEYTLRWRAKHNRRYKDLRIKGRYGLEVGSYEKMLSAQNGRCAICKTTNPGGRGTFSVDHCHTTGNVRGLLCIACNMALGKFQHDPAVLRTAIEYLKRGEPPLC